MSDSPFKVLIVEDEILLLKNMRKKITSISPDFLITGEAFNGKEALEQISHCHPDIIFTDIRMPIMDGIELSKIIHETYPNIVIIIVSGYDEFEYARSAMHYGVYDYLLKPLRIESLKQLMVSLKKKLQTQRKEQNFSLLKKQLSGEPDSSETNSTNLKNSFFSFVMICFGNLPLRCKPELLLQNMQPKLANFLEESFWNDLPFSLSDFYIFSDFAANIKILLSGNIESPKKIVQALHPVLKHHFETIPVYIAYYTLPVAYEQLFQQLVLLREKLLSSLVIGDDTYITIEHQNAEMPPSVFSISEINYLQTIITSNNKTDFQNTMKNYFHDWAGKHYTQQWIEKSLLQILAILQQNLFFSDDDYEKMYQTVFLFLETEPSLSSAGDKIIPELVYWLTKNNTISTEIENTIEELYNYICSHYTDTINLSELAVKYHFNHSYLTRTFKKQKGESPVKLINTLRIDDAKKLLLNPDLSIREISEMLGFSNQHYFSRIFKDATGCTPKEYRAGSIQ